MLERSGCCLCSAVRFRLLGEPLKTYCCHCSQCRRSSGSAFAVNLLVRRRQFQFLRGTANDLGSYESSPGKLRRSCAVCASPIYNELTALPHLLSVRGGLLDEIETVVPQIHIHTESQQSWCEFSGHVPTVAGALPIDPAWLTP